jgi:hypothetical protein
VANRRVLQGLFLAPVFTRQAHRQFAGSSGCNLLRLRVGFDPEVGWRPIRRHLGDRNVARPGWTGHESLVSSRIRLSDLGIMADPRPDRLDGAECCGPIEGERQALAAIARVRADCQTHTSRSRALIANG